MDIVLIVILVSMAIDLVLLTRRMHKRFDSLESQLDEIKQQLKTRH